ncbi:MAG: hypothetical protein LBP91_03095 [Coriobacteriales bacterium]|jgi:drug/metabolite transporter (DMT)-like permease|nr:hypothetical protein [Coriobacteriales bacterium]
MNDSVDLKQARRARTASFFKKGILIALFSGLLYGFYSAFIVAATSSAAWYPGLNGAEGWYGGADGWYDQVLANQIPDLVNIAGASFSVLMAVVILGALGSGINDFISSLWMIGKAAFKGKFMDFLRCYKSKPGLVMIVCALIGGPIASTAYIIALLMSGPIAAPITALCPAVGAIIGWLFLKQGMNLRIGIGIIICVIATFMISSTAFEDFSLTDPMYLAGLAIALIAALGWGIEGAIGGFGTSVIDYEISISIRQFTSGVFTLFIMVPVLFLIAGHFGLFPTMLVEAVQGPLVEDGLLASPLIFFLISGLAAGFSFAFWYKGNSMCGAALGMACNGGFSFWVPFVSFLVLGLYLGWEGYALAPIQWIAALVMVLGIFLIAVNPLEFFKKQKEA